MRGQEAAGERVLVWELLVQPGFCTKAVGNGRAEAMGLRRSDLLTKGNGSMIRAVLFDLGDTLLDFQPMDRLALFRGVAETTYSFLRSRGCALPGFGTYYRRHIWAVRWAYIWATVRGREIDSVRTMQRFCGKQGYPTDEEFITDLLWMWYQPIIPRSSVAADVIPTLRSLRDAGLKMGIVSNTLLPGRILDRHLEMEGLKEFFPVRVYSSEITYRKPKPIIFRAALAEIAAGADECLFVGDMVKTDIAGARRVGMRSVLRRTARKQDYAAADHVIECIGDLRQLVLGQQRGAEVARQ